MGTPGYRGDACQPETYEIATNIVCSLGPVKNVLKRKVVSIDEPDKLIQDLVSPGSFLGFVVVIGSAIAL